jgi:5'-3' exonuclease
MGINRLNTFLKEKCPSAYKSYPLSKWYKCRIAVDASHIIYTFWSTAHSAVVNKTNNLTEDPDRTEIIRLALQTVWSFVQRFLNAGITPVFVFDGTPPPEKELITKSKRRNQKERVNDKINDIKSRIESIDILDRTPDMDAELKKMCRQNLVICQEDVEAFKTVLIGMGLPVLQAIGEAEELCSHLCSTGKVAAVYSSDIDNLANGCPVLITGKDGNKYNEESGRMEEHYTVTILQNVLTELGISRSQFVDLCIMSGCDYNVNIAGIGVAKAFKLLKDYQSIDNLPKVLFNKPVNIETLNHLRCREIFSDKTYLQVCEEPDYQLMINKSALSDYGRDYLQSYNVDKWIKPLYDIYSVHPEPSFEAHPTDISGIPRPTKIRLIIRNISSPITMKTTSTSNNSTTPTSITLPLPSPNIIGESPILNIQAQTQNKTHNLIIE